MIPETSSNHAALPRSFFPRHQQQIARLSSATTSRDQTLIVRNSPIESKPNL